MTAFFSNAFHPPTFVLDVSVAAGWLLSSRASGYTIAALSRVTSLPAVVPAGFPTDIADAWLDGERRGETTAVTVTAYLVSLRNFLIHLDDNRQPHVWTATVPFARQFGLSVSQAAYLELAARLNLPLATTDPGLISAAQTAGVTRLVH